MRINPHLRYIPRAIRQNFIGALLVTLRYQDGKTKRMQTRILSGPKFLWLILRHVLPKGFRRTRNFGFLHPNSKRLLELLGQLLKLNPVKILIGLAKRPQINCPCCGGAMRIVQTRIPAPVAFGRFASSRVEAQPVM